MTINIKTEEHIMLIEIDRPKKYNALTREMYNADGAGLLQTGSGRQFMGWCRLRQRPAFYVGTGTDRLVGCV